MRHALLCLLALVACGVPGVPGVPGVLVVPSGSRAPGWHDVPHEPAAASFAQVDLELQPPATLAGTLPDGIELAVQWPGEAPRRFTGTFPEPPAAARTGAAPCQKAEGLLLAYQGTELVGVSFKQTDRFPYLQTAYNQRLVWEQCRTQPRQLLPLFLFHDPRLPLALCDQSCTMPLLDRTRIHAVSFTLSGDGTLLFSPSLVAKPKDAKIAITVNGQPFDAPVGQLSLRAQDTSPIHPGENAVKVVVGDLPAWEATLALPEGRLQPRVSAVRVGSDFTVEWNELPGATRFDVQVWPREPVLKVGALFFRAESSPFTARYDGWRDVNVTRVSVRVTAQVTAEPSYHLAISDDVEAPASR